MNVPLVGLTEMYTLPHDTLLLRGQDRLVLTASFHVGNYLFLSEMTSGSIRLPL